MTYRECLDYFHELSVHRNIDGLQDDTYFQLMLLDVTVDIFIFI